MVGDSSGCRLRTTSATRSSGTGLPALCSKESCDSGTPRGARFLRRAGRRMMLAPPSSPLRSSAASSQDCGSDRAERGNRTREIGRSRTAAEAASTRRSVAMQAREGAIKSIATGWRYWLDEGWDAPASVAAFVREQQRSGRHRVAARLPMFRETGSEQLRVQHSVGRSDLGDSTSAAAAPWVGASVAKRACGRWSIRPWKQAPGHWSETRLSPKAWLTTAATPEPHCVCTLRAESVVLPAPARLDQMTRTVNMLVPPERSIETS
jgi:hypothetical protein